MSFYRYFPDFEHVFAHWIGHIGFNFRAPIMLENSGFNFRAPLLCENYCHAKFGESKVYIYIYHLKGKATNFFRP